MAKQSLSGSEGLFLPTLGIKQTTTKTKQKQKTKNKKVVGSDFQRSELSAEAASISASVVSQCGHIMYTPEIK